ncbi:MAG: hypothetical protein AB8F78_07520 [Saprospiraceae bacterium]
MKTLCLTLLIAITGFSLPAFAQLEVQIGAGALFSDMNEVFDGPSSSTATSGDASIRPYFNGLVGTSFTEKWNIRARLVGTSRAEKYVGAPLGIEAFTYSAYYFDLGAELQWKPVSLLGLSVGPYYSLDTYERVTSAGSSVKPIVELYDNYVSIRPAVEVFFGPLVARLETSFGVTPAQRLMYTDANGQPAGEVSRYWNGASVGLSYRLIKA